MNKRIYIIIYIAVILIGYNIWKSVQNNIMSYAVTSNSISLVKKCIKNGADVNGRIVSNDLPLNIAIRNMNYDMVDLLLLNHANPMKLGKDGLSPIEIAAMEADWKIFQRLTSISSGIDYNHLLVLSVIGNNIDVTTKIIKKANPQYIDENGNTALCFVKTYAVAAVLVERGFNVNFNGKDGKTAMHNAAIYGNAELINYLASVGANVNGIDNSGRTPLHDAANEGGLTDNISALIAHGANINARDFTGNTPLHYCAMSSRGEDIATVKLLLKNGGHKSLNKKNNNGDYPFTIAEKFHYVNVRKLLYTNGN